MHRRVITGYYANPTNYTSIYIVVSVGRGPKPYWVPTNDHLPPSSHLTKMEELQTACFALLTTLQSWWPPLFETTSEGGVDSEAASHPTSTISIHATLMSPNQGETAVSGSSIFVGWLWGRWSLVANLIGLRAPLPTVTLILAWCSWWVWCNIQWLFSDLLPLQWLAASNHPPLCMYVNDSLQSVRSHQHQTNDPAVASIWLEISTPLSPSTTLIFVFHLHRQPSSKVICLHQIFELINQALALSKQVMVCGDLNVILMDCSHPQAILLYVTVLSPAIYYCQLSHPCKSQTTVQSTWKYFSYKHGRL